MADHTTQDRWRRHEVTYPRACTGVAVQAPGREVETQDQLEELLASGSPLTGLRLQGLDLTGAQDHLLGRRDVTGLIVLGGRVPARLEHHLRAHGAVLFPTGTALPVQPYRGRLYTAAELYSGLSERGYTATPDARAFAWAQDAGLRHDAYASLLRAIHDDAMNDALAAVVAGRAVVGVMGGHALARDEPGFAAAAHLAHQLAGAGTLVATGGGPGAMEAANLGAWAADTDILTRTLRALAEVPHFDTGITPWARLALDLREGAPERGAGAERSIGIPTWFYGHEPPNVWGDVIAKFFSNALREDLLLQHSSAGVVVLPGAAGTVQEVFQTATRLYYDVVARDEARVAPLVLVGVDHWTGHLPVWPLLQALARDRPMAGALHLVDDVADVPALLLG